MLIPNFGWSIGHGESQGSGDSREGRVVKKRVYIIEDPETYTQPQDIITPKPSQQATLTSSVYQMRKSTIPPQAGMSKMRYTYSLASLPSFDLMFQDSASKKDKVAGE